MPMTGHTTQKPTAGKILAVAPMMALTDRHCRYLHRLYAPNALLFTEMVAVPALLVGKQWQQLDFDPQESPVALQLGGSDPAALARCAQAAEARGFAEVNLNVGCPSERVQQGAFGACLMRSPDLVAECVAAMQRACSLPVTVKCRLGVDNDDSDEFLERFIETVAQAGVRTFYVHARKAILGGLTPAQNRHIPPLQPERVEQLKRNHPRLTVVINGGISTTAEAAAHLHWADGVMIGRSAYYQPDLLAACQQMMFDAGHVRDTMEIIRAYRIYMDRRLAEGERLHSLTRHLLSVCNGLPGARRFRRTLSDTQRLKSNDASVLVDALRHVFPEAA